MTLAKTSRSCHNEYRVPRGLRPRALRPRGNASRNPRARFFYATEGYFPVGAVEMGMREERKCILWSARELQYPALNAEL